MVKVLSFSFKQYLCQFTMLLVKGSSEKRLLRHLSNHLFRSPLLQKYIRSEDNPFFGNFEN